MLMSGLRLSDLNKETTYLLTYTRGPCLNGITLHCTIGRCFWFLETKCFGCDGGAEYAGLENAGVAKMQGWKTRDWKMQESETYGKRRFQKCVSDCTD